MDFFSYRPVLHREQPMLSYNPLQKHIRDKHRPPLAGQSISVGPETEGLKDPDLRESLVEAGADAGHWKITRRPLGRFVFILTEEGAAHLSEDPFD